MTGRFRLKLLLLLISFTTAIATAIAVSDFYSLRKQAIHYNQLQVNQIEENVKEALLSLEKAYTLFDLDASSKMEEHGRYLLDLYKDNPSFETWDFEQLKKQLDLDLYVIDDRNVITHASFKEDIGLDFERCCPSLAQRLTQLRRLGGEMIDGLDIEQETGRIKKYAYFATPDRRYIIQLGYNVQNSRIFEEFNFLKVIDQQVNRHPCITAVHVLNRGGHPLGKPVEGPWLTGARRDAFETTLKTTEMTEVRDFWQGEPVVFRYTHYQSPYDRGSTREKVLEIIYTELSLQHILRQQTKAFVIKLLFIILGASLVALFISRWVARPMYLAFHDTLTGLKNRTAFEETIHEDIRGTAPKNGHGQSTANATGRFALMIIDLDNFKEVNDRLGHDNGDRLLKGVAQAICSVLRKDDVPFRLGGDEFVVLMPGADERTARQMADRIIEAVTALTSSSDDISGRGQSFPVTVSIGIALCPEHGVKRNVLFKHADQALYMAKEKGKNKYQIYLSG